MMTIIELFAGIGTQLHALKEVHPKVESLGISEIDVRPLKAYKALLGTFYNFGDITKIETLPKADIWTYSFPCTDLSIAGKQKGFSGEHSSLIYEVYRLLLASEKPKILLMENVANICNTTFMPKFQEWINNLKELGYTSSWQKIKACQFGGGTIRERVFMISVLDDKGFKFPANIQSTTTLKDFLEPIDSNYRIDTYEGPADITTPCYDGAKKLTDYNNGGQGNRIYSIMGQGVTLTAQGGGKAGSSGGLYLREGDIYKLSPIEMCKVMGWSLEDANKICSVLTPREVGFCLGNAIDRNVLIHLFKAIINQYFE
jgi:DNA-cytosine methyltransferase